MLQWMGCLVLRRRHGNLSRGLFEELLGERRCVCGKKDILYACVRILTCVCVDIFMCAFVDIWLVSDG